MAGAAASDGPELAPAITSWTSASYPPAAAAGKKYHERDTRAEPDRSLNCHIHSVSPFSTYRRDLVPGMNPAKPALPPGLDSGYRVGFRDRRRFRKIIIIPPAAIHIPACMSVSLIVCSLLC
uniref:Uncharacterized protein n=1 Tax=Solibacter usitatus (strain Ellin6076) TaxID=234267 RepID=Q02DB6_SOLUE